jgi:hypothetical protein
VHLHAVLPPEQQQFAQQVAPSRDPDQDAEVEPAPDDDLFDIANLSASLAEDRQQVGGEARGILPGDRHEDGFVAVS